MEEELACIKKHLDQQSISLVPMPQVTYRDHGRPAQKMTSHYSQCPLYWKCLAPQFDVYNNESVTTECETRKLLR